MEGFHFRYACVAMSISKANLIMAFDLLEERANYHTRKES